MYTAREIVGQNLNALLDERGPWQKSFFWQIDPNDKTKVVPLKEWNVFDYVKKFLPQFGFYKYRDPLSPDSDYRVIQMMGRRVKIIGDLKDSAIADSLFDWTIETLQYMQGVAVGLPDQDNLEKAIMRKQDLFSKWTMKFLRALPKVESVLPDEEGNLKSASVDQVPLVDEANRAFLCFSNGIVQIVPHKELRFTSYKHLPPEFFVWDSQVRSFSITQEDLDIGPHGVWWDFIQDCSKEYDPKRQSWVVNHGMKETLTTAYGYLLHDFTPPDLRKAIVLYDRTSAEREGGVGKSILADGINAVRPYFWIDGKRLNGEVRFMMDGYTEDKRVVLFSDLRKDWKLEDYYNMITDGFTVEGKGKSHYVIPKKKAPKILINTNYTIPAMSRSDRRRLHFVPVSQYYGVLGDSGKSIADVHGGWLLEDNWSKEDWIAFYVTCVHCLHLYLEKGLVRFDDEVLADRQLISAAGGNEDLLNTLKTFIKEVVSNGGECTKQQVLDLYSCPEFEWCQDYKTKWKTQRFKDVAAGLGYSINPGRPRYQRSINGQVVDIYRLVEPVQPKPGTVTGTADPSIPVYAPRNSVVVKHQEDEVPESPFAAFFPKEVQ